MKEVSFAKFCSTLEISTRGLGGVSGERKGVGGEEKDAPPVVVVQRAGEDAEAIRGDDGGADETKEEVAANRRGDGVGELGLDHAAEHNGDTAHVGRDLVGTAEDGVDELVEDGVEVRLVLLDDRFDRHVGRGRDLKQVR